MNLDDKLRNLKKREYPSDTDLPFDADIFSLIGRQDILKNES